MKLGEYVKSLVSFCSAHPEAVGLDVVMASDEVGIMYFKDINSPPQIGSYEDGDFVSEDQLNLRGLTEDDINSVCIN